MKTIPDILFILSLEICFLPNIRSCDTENGVPLDSEFQAVNYPTKEKKIIKAKSLLKYVVFVGLPFLISNVL